MPEVGLQLTEEAVQTIGDMEARVALIATMYGERSQEYVKAVQSLAHVLATMFRLGGRISKDGELSLLGCSFMTYGIIWFGKCLDNNQRDPVLGDWSCHS